MTDAAEASLPPLTSAQSRWQERKRAQGLCATCGRRELKTKHHCAECAKRRTERARVRRMEAKEKGRGAREEAVTELRTSILGLRLLRKRNQRGLRDVAPEIGISAATLSRIERGFPPSLPSLVKITRWLNVDFSTVCAWVHYAEKPGKPKKKKTT